MRMRIFLYKKYKISLFFLKSVFICYCHHFISPILQNDTKKDNQKVCRPLIFTWQITVIKNLCLLKNKLQEIEIMHFEILWFSNLTSSETIRNNINIYQYKLMHSTSLFCIDAPPPCPLLFKGMKTNSQFFHWDLYKTANKIKNIILTLDTEFH